MAAILEKVLAKEIDVQDVISWLLKPDSEGNDSGILSQLDDVKEDVIPFLLNFLRDQTLHLIQGCRSTTTTPAKTPSSLLKVKKKSSTPASQPPGHKSNRVQLFRNNSREEGDARGGTPGENAGRGPRKQLHRPAGSGDSRPNSRGNHTHQQGSNGPGHHGNQGGYRMQQSPTPEQTRGPQRSRQSLADFLCTPGGGRGPGGVASPEDPSPRSRRRSGNHGNHGNRRSAEKKQRGRAQENTPPVFNADDFPPVGGTPSPGPATKPSPVVPSGAQIITPSRRITTTLLSPNNATPDNSIFKLSKELSQPVVKGAWLSPVDNRPKAIPLSLVSPPPGMYLKSIPEIGRSPNSPWSRPLVDKNSSKAIRRVELNTVSPGSADESYDSPVFKRVVERDMKIPDQSSNKYSTPKKTVTISTNDQVTPVKSSGPSDNYTPTKSLLERLASIEIQPADLNSVTHKPELKLIAQLYSGCIRENLVPNLSVEMYFLTQLLTARGGELELPGDIGQDLDEVHYFSSIHNAVFFSVSVFSTQKRLLTLLDRGTMRLIADNQRVGEFAPELKRDLINRLDNSPIKASTGNLYPSPVSGVSFQADTDNRKNFPSEKCFHMFKKQRDSFYELLREWEENHLSPGWSVLDAQGEKIRRLVNYRTELANHVHFARLFQSQLMQMCKGDQGMMTEGEDDANISLLSQLKLTNPEKLKRLQERFTTPSSMGGPCPPASFPGCQEFFRDFIVAAASHVFNQHLSDSMASKIAELNETPFTSHGADDQDEDVIVDAEDHEALLGCLLGLKLLGKFLGFVTFLPYQSPEALPESVSQSFISMRNQTSPVVDILLHLKQSQLEGRVVITVPWVLDFLSMADPMAPQLDYYQIVFILLIKIYRETGELFTQTGSHTQLLLVVMLGWFFDLAIFPAELFFKEHKSTEKESLLKTLPKSCVDRMDIVDQQILYTCCPYLGEVRNLLMDFAVGMSSRNNNVRKITPVSTKPLVTSSVSEKQLQHQLEDNFFHNHPASLKRTVEFVADRVASNQIKNFRGHVFPGLLEEGLTGAKDLARPLQGQSPDSRAKKKLLEKVDRLSAEMSRKSRSTSMSTAQGYCEGKTSTILPLLLPEGVDKQVLSVSSQISVRIATEKINSWLNTHLTTAMFKRELVAEFEKALRSTVSHDRNQSAKALSGTGTNSSGKATHASDIETEPQPHSLPSPSDTVIIFKDLLKELLMGERCCDEAAVLNVLATVRDVLQYRGDLINPVSKCLAKLTVDLTYILVLEYPTLWTEDIRSALLKLWAGELQRFANFDHIVSPKNITLLFSSPDQQCAREKFVRLVTDARDLGLVTAGHLATGCLTIILQTCDKEILGYIGEIHLNAIRTMTSSDLETGEGARFLEILDSVPSDSIHPNQAEILLAVTNKISDIRQSDTQKP